MPPRGTTVKGKAEAPELRVFCSCIPPEHQWAGHSVRLREYLQLLLHCGSQVAHQHSAIHGHCQAKRPAQGRPFASRVQQDQNV